MIGGFIVLCVFMVVWFLLTVQVGLRLESIRKELDELKLRVERIERIEILKRETIKL